MHYNDLLSRINKVFKVLKSNTCLLCDIAKTVFDCIMKMYVNIHNQWKVRFQTIFDKKEPSRKFDNFAWYSNQKTIDMFGHNIARHQNIMKDHKTACNYFSFCKYNCITIIMQSTSVFTIKYHNQLSLVNILVKVILLTDHHPKRKQIPTLSVSDSAV